MATRLIVQMQHDNDRIFVLCNDGTLWTTVSTVPFVWRQLPAFTGAQPSSIGVCNTLPANGPLTRYVICSNGSIWYLLWATDGSGSGTWTQGNAVPTS